MFVSSTARTLVNRHWVLYQEDMKMLNLSQEAAQSRSKWQRETKNATSWSRFARRKKWPLKRCLCVCFLATFRPDGTARAHRRSIQQRKLHRLTTPRYYYCMYFRIENAE